jgi:hypothetical protein
MAYFDSVVWSGVIWYIWALLAPLANALRATRIVPRSRRSDPAGRDDAMTPDWPAVRSE